MKIGVLSDTHLTRVTPALERIIEEQFRDVDLLLHLGDLVSLSIYRFLQKRPLEAVRGNMDERLLREELPDKRILTFGKFRIGMMHGWGAPAGLEERLRQEFSGVNAIVYGHSHLPANHESGGVLFFNPGSASGFRHGPSVGRLHLDAELKGEIIAL